MRLFAVGTAGELKRFRVVEFAGTADRADMPSQGRFAFESDRQKIIALEDQMISAFGHEVLRMAAGEEGRPSPSSVDLGAKMLRAEHVPTLAALAESGGFAATRALSFNACAQLPELPPLDGMLALHTLSCINCAALRALPDLSGVPSLRVLKLEGCVALQRLPARPPSLDRDASTLPDHLSWDG